MTRNDINFSFELIPNSILTLSPTSSASAIDQNAPLPFLDWLNYYRGIQNSPNEFLNLYSKYIEVWNTISKTSTQSNQNIIQQSYINLLQEISLKYSTPDEKRFLSNLDFTNIHDIEIALPFFTRKIKNICIYYSKVRDQIPNQVIASNLGGSNFGIESLIKKYILNLSLINQFEDVPLDIPPLSAINSNLNVSISELYDLSSDYYDKPLGSTSNDPFRNKFYSDNIIPVDPRLFYDFNSALVNAISSYPMFITELFGNFSINLDFTINDINLLKNRDFISTLNDGNSANLNLQNQKTLIEQYSGTDFYYLSTNNTGTAYVSALLFQASNPYQNLLNVNNISINRIPDTTQLYTEEQIGSFFLPQNMGLLYWYAPSKTFEVNIGILQPNTVYVYPDPQKYLNHIGNSKQDTFDIPIIFSTEVSWNRVKSSNQQHWGYVKSDSFKQKFWAYLSQSEMENAFTAGISRSSDIVDFWNPNSPFNWNQENIFPLIENDVYPINSRNQTLLFTNDTVTQWFSDIYGNEYALFKPIHPSEEQSALKGNLSTNSTYLSNNYNPAFANLVSQRDSLVGKLYFRNNVSTIVQPFSAIFTSLIQKYPINIQNEINNGIIDFTIIYDFLILETQNYVIYDKIEFSYNNNNISNSTTIPNYFSKYLLSNKLERYLKFFYNEDTDIVTMGFLRLYPSLSATSYKMLYPVLYDIDIDTLQYTQIYPNYPINLQSLSYYSLTGTNTFINVVQTDSPQINYSTDLETLNVSYRAINENTIPFFVNETFKNVVNYVSSYGISFLSPNYYLHDKNYSNNDADFEVRYKADYSQLVGYQNYNAGTFVFGNSSTQYTNYLYLSSGGYYFPVGASLQVVFDNTYTDSITITLGSRNFIIQDVYDQIVFDYNGPNQTIFTTNNQTTTVTWNGHSYLITFSLPDVPVIGFQFLN